MSAGNFYGPDLSSLSEEDFCEAVAAAYEDPLAWDAAEERISELPFRHPTTTLGYIPEDAAGRTPLQVASEVAAGTELIGRRINVSLDAFYVERYPGERNRWKDVAVSFTTKHRVADKDQEVTFTKKYQVRDGQAASVSGDRVFRGVVVPPDGLVFECATKKLTGRSTRRVAEVLDSEEVKKGLTLLTSWQPLLGPLVSLAKGLFEKNIDDGCRTNTQEIALGLDFSNSATHARLNKGTYFAIQAPTGTAVSEYSYDRGGHHLYAEDGEPIAYNYLMFGVTEYTGDGDPD